MASGYDGIPDRPIVGILSLPHTDAFQEAHNLNITDVKGIIPSSYVRWLQSAGAQVVVIPHFWDAGSQQKLISKLSGILFTGGDYGDDNWNRTTAMIYNEVIRRNGTSEPLALWATCLGYERVLQVASQSNRTIVKAMVMDKSLPIGWSIDISSPFFNYMGNLELSKFEKFPIGYNFHYWGATPESWHAHRDQLDPIFNVLGYQEYRHQDTDETIKFVAMIEGKYNLPIWAVQFHPEKALFEWSPNLHYPHSETAVLANRKIADFFVTQVRKFSKNSRGFNNFEDESKFGIYNYQTVFTGADVNATHAIFTETYIIQ
jgi:gamma-glutamyl hydrolase